MGESFGTALKIRHLCGLQRLFCLEDVLRREVNSALLHWFSLAYARPQPRRGVQRRLGGRPHCKTRTGNVYLRRILCQAVWDATGKKGSYLGVLYRRVRARRGHQKAIMAVAYQILAVIYHTLCDNQPYKEPGVTSYDEKRKPQVTRRLV